MPNSNINLGVRYINDTKPKKKKKDYTQKDDRNAVRRLYKDMKELALCAHELPNVSAEPLEDNIYLWHANVRAPDGKLAGLVVHMEIQFPSFYPRDPPKIRILTPIRHPNVFGKWICLSMLRPRRATKNVPHEAWSGGYTVASILLQMQSFLFSENVPQDYGKDCKLYSQNDYFQNQQAKFVCKHPSCFHSAVNVYPPFICGVVDGENDSKRADKNTDLDESKLGKAAKDQYSGHQLQDLKKNNHSTDKREVVFVKKGKEKWEDEDCCCFPYAAVFDLMEFLGGWELTILGYLYPSWKQAQLRYALQEKREATCFYTKLDYKEAALGYGVRVTRDKHDRTKIRELACEMDLISYHAWRKLDYKTSVWGYECDEYIPLVLNKSHCENSGKLMWKYITRLAGGKNDEAVLDALSGLMNSCVVGLMKEKGKIRMHHSEKALEGYCRFHQLFLHMCKLRPSLRAIAEDNIEQFIKDFWKRHKTFTPDLGRLLVQLSITDKYSWDDFKDALLEETLTRNVLWYCKDNPFLRFDHDTRSFGSWYRVNGKVDFYPSIDDAKPTKFFPDGELIHGEVYRKDSRFLKVITPSRGFVKMKSENGDLAKVPFKYPCLCRCDRKALARAGINFDTPEECAINKGTYVVVTEVVGNRARVSYSAKLNNSARARFGSHFVQAVRTIYGNAIISMEELSTANTVWVSLANSYTKNPILTPVAVPDHYRLDETFKLIEVSRRLLMFQRSFLKIIKGEYSVEENYDQYLKRFGYARPGALEKLHKECCEIKSTKTWPDYLSWLEVDVLSKKDMVELLKRTVGYSLKKKYHKQFHPNYNRLPEKDSKTATKWKKKTTGKAKKFGKSKAFTVDEAPENYVSKFFAPRPKVKREPVATPPPITEIRAARGNAGKGVKKTVVFHKLFIPGLDVSKNTKDVFRTLRGVLGKIPVFVPGDDKGMCKGFAFGEFQDLKRAETLVNEGLRLGPNATVFPKYAKPSPKKPKRKSLRKRKKSSQENKINAKSDPTVVVAPSKCKEEIDEKSSEDGFVIISTATTGSL